MVDVEDGTSTNPSNFGFSASGTKYTSSPLTLTDAGARVGNGAFGNGILDVRSGEVIKVSYRDKTSNASDTNKLRTSLANVVCIPALVGQATFGVYGLDRIQEVVGGCERDARGLFTFGNPDQFMDEGESFTYAVAFQSADTDLVDVQVSLRCVCADSDSPAECQPGSLPTPTCTDPNRTNNSSCAACGVNITILDSPKVIGDPNRRAKRGDRAP